MYLNKPHARPAEPFGRGLFLLFKGSYLGVGQDDLKCEEQAGRLFWRDYESIALIVSYYKNTILSGFSERSFALFYARVGLSR